MSDPADEPYFCAGSDATEQDDGIDFQESLEELYETFTKLSDEAKILRANVDVALTGVLGL